MAIDDSSTGDPAGLDTQVRSRRDVLGFAILDHQAGNDAIGVWLTSLAGPSASHTNAVVTTISDEQRISALLAARILVVTPGTDWTEFPQALTPDVLGKRFTTAVTDARSKIDSAISQHAVTVGNRNLIRPDWHSEPASPKLDADLDVAHRTLAVANYVAALWQWWLDTESERRRRISFPAMRAAGLDDPQLVALPPEVLSR